MELLFQLPKYYEGEREKHSHTVVHSVRVQNKDDFVVCSEKAYINTAKTAFEAAAACNKLQQKPHLQNQFQALEAVEGSEVKSL